MDKEASRVTHHASRITHHASRITFDIYLVGVGGQGVLTIGDLITTAALEAGLPVNFYPTKGMAQRGGFVKAQVRIGRPVAGPEIPERGADLVIAMERSEALKALRYAKPGGHCVLFGHVWPPTAVMLGQAPYPSLEQVRAQVRESGATLHYLDPDRRPHHGGAPVPANVYVLGAVLGHTPLRDVLNTTDVERIVTRRWKKGVERNRLAFQAGLKAGEG